MKKHPVPTLGTGSNDPDQTPARLADVVPSGMDGEVRTEDRMRPMVVSSVVEGAALWSAFMRGRGNQIAQVFEIGLWSIQPSKTREGWWRVMEDRVGDVGGWSATLPFTAAEMLWAGIESHYASEGSRPLYVAQSEHGALTRLR